MNLVIRKMVAQLLLLVGLSAFTSVTVAQSPADLNDLEIAHAAYVADNIDIQYAHLALALSTNPDIHEFARTMIRDHEAVNEQALALLAKLGVEAKDNFLSQKLIADSKRLMPKTSLVTIRRLTGWLLRHLFQILRMLKLRLCLKRD